MISGISKLGRARTVRERLPSTRLAASMSRPTRRLCTQEQTAGRVALRNREGRGSKEDYTKERTAGRAVPRNRQQGATDSRENCIKEEAARRAAQRNVQQGGLCKETDSREQQIAGKAARRIRQQGGLHTGTDSRRHTNAEGHNARLDCIDLIAAYSSMMAFQVEMDDGSYAKDASLDLTQPYSLRQGTIVCQSSRLCNLNLLVGGPIPASRAVHPPRVGALVLHLAFRLQKHRATCSGRALGSNVALRDVLFSERGFGRVHMYQTSHKDPQQPGLHSIVCVYPPYGHK
eukprot:scaffold191097_cov17-Tisochrysis_lutea.AAC.1